MKLNYINEIKANISIHSSKKTSSILEGTYKSIYRGKSMNFENLREYVYDDDIKDIDWKASARTGKLLVKQFIAEKKHNIMIILDTGIKMYGDSKLNEEKREIATYIAGTLGYLASTNGDYTSMIYNNNDSIIINPFKNDLYHLEYNLIKYHKLAINPNNEGINKTISYLSKYLNKRMIIFVITDLSGMENINEKYLKELRINSDILFININDINMNIENLYDIENNNYIPQIFLKDEKLHQLEEQLKNEIYNKQTEKLKKLKIDIVSINTKKEIQEKIIELLERHKYASIH